MGWLKKLGILYGVFLGLIILLVLGARIMLPIYPTLSDGLFNALANEDYPEAYQMLSTKFQSQFTLAQFQHLVHLRGYDEFHKGQWEPPMVEPEKAKMRGALLLKSGQRVPIELYFVYEPDNKSIHDPNLWKKKLTDWNIYRLASPWKIHAIREL